MLPLPLRFILLGAENAVTGIAETRHNVVTIVQLFIQHADIHLHIGVYFSKGRKALRGGDDAHKLDVGGARAF